MRREGVRDGVCDCVEERRSHGGQWVRREGVRDEVCDCVEGRRKGRRSEGEQ